VAASEGAWDDGQGEIDDALAVIAAHRDPALPLALAGFSFGGYVASQAAARLPDDAKAERLVLVKSCDIDPALSLAELGERGIVDQRFGSLSEGAAFPIDVVHCNEVDRVRMLLLGGGRYGA